MKGSDIAGIPI